MEKSYAKIIIIGNKVVREKVLLVFCLVVHSCIAIFVKVLYKYYNVLHI